jgi:hypothetical protein
MFGPQRRSGLDALLDRPRRSPWQEFRQSPLVFIARQLYYALRAPLVVPAERLPPADAVSVVCISDTHNSQPVLPDGDVLIHAGDLTQSGTLPELQQTLVWLRSQPHPHKIVVAGNHDLLLDGAYMPSAGADAQRAQLDWGGVVYLEDSETTVTCANGRRLRIYGSPRSPRHGNWAFQYPRSEDIWASSRCHLDPLTLGCPHLLRELWRVRPVLHVFGHVHAGYGQEWLSFDRQQEAYERTVLAGGGLWNVLAVLRELVVSWFCSPHAAADARCLLVNPSMVGGLWDAERRLPIKVVI